MSIQQKVNKNIDYKNMNSFEKRKDSMVLDPNNHACRSNLSSLRGNEERDGDKQIITLAGKKRRT